MSAVLKTIIVLAVAAAVAGSGQSVRAAGVAVLSSSGIPAYRSAVEGLQSAFKDRGDEALAVFELTSEDDIATIERLRATKPQIVVSVGSRATAVAAATGIPYLSTMLLGEETPQGQGSKNRLASVTLDISPQSVFTRIRQLFPAWRRIGVIRGRSQPEPPAEEIRAAAAALGLSVELMQCSGPKEVLEALRSLRGRADVVWCLPNRALYQPAMVHALILDSIRYRLPLIGFSEAFVSAGGLVGFLPDYRDIGRQTAELVRRYQGGQAQQGEERPRTIRTMVNERVVRALGIELNAAAKGVQLVK
jgi:putative ABC transport system substrate-binding protein